MEMEWKAASEGLRFLWLELTLRCSLRCTHCYAESASGVATENSLTEKEYLDLIDSAAELGCRHLQFIGGEPTLVPELPHLIEHARRRNFEMVEVFTNATRISFDLLCCFVRGRVAVASSFYSADPRIHDSITGRPGSHRATVRTLKSVIAAGLNVRVGIVVMEQNREHVAQTIDFLHSIGVLKIQTDRVRGVGRGRFLVSGACQPGLSELCGECWKGSAAVAPDGTLMPCIMSREWAVGSVRKESLEALVASSAMRDIRERVRREVWLPRQVASSSCNPDCMPVDPNCDPNYGQCSPFQKCGPEHPPGPP